MSARLDFTQHGLSHGRLVKRPGRLIWIYRATVAGREFELTTRQIDFDAALARAKILEARIIRNLPSRRRTPYVNPVDGGPWHDEIMRCAKIKGSWLGYMYRRASDRSRRRGKALSLTYDELVAIALRSRGGCEVTSIPFSFSKLEGDRVGAYAPALDRIDSRGPYSFTNCRLVCNCVNAAMGPWGEGVLVEIAKAMRPACNKP